ncbi:helix-turn-helix transcriptional regulator [Pseudoflavonifractor phocaeensis]|uniref:helix-turn-helix domain-containing protein n=1 Tax=Pseudoflavonifractor phocaeensis TaxID=1870988 RepID=UPI0019571CD2|nr:helix-turn-helix transcriptional regulator [Pseudoflavonifractor phocaeensis]MBM6871807.1 helix-turn-helix transcriptional regulator [Pseudoflavonifractor phocaeensis]MBM6938299.1 helix-turn-helix transcriptional regulator [Pseudoflavonifractor phocaeensis]
MVTMAQRIEALRTETGLSRPALSAALGFPKNAVEKFETGRQTPTKEQQEKMAAYFGVSIFYLRGESSDRTRQDDWMDFAGVEDPTPVSAPKPPAAKPGKAVKTGEGTVLDAVLSGRQFQDLLRSAVLDTLSSPEGQELIAKVVRRELERRR